jgi:OPT family small oligopeptide transporter
MDTQAFGENDRSHVVIMPPSQRPRRIPDVPEDVFIMDHLNDPNFDLTQNRNTLISLSSDSFELESRTAVASSPSYSSKPLPSPPGYSSYGKRSEGDTDSQFTSTRFSADSKYTPMKSEFSDFDHFDDESPYPEVRAAVADVDVPSMPVNTFRMWFLGMFYVILVSGLNQFFEARYPTVFVGGFIVQLTALPLGKALEKILPTTRFRTFGCSWSLNPGPFNIKEHVLITVMANIVQDGTFATIVIGTQKMSYGQNLSFGYQVLLVLGTQVIGFSFAGLLRQFLVFPQSMIWPSALVNSVLFHTLHRNYGKRETKHISREKFFCIALACSFLWYWIPGYLFTALSVFNWVCWIAPSNVVVNTLFGTSTGLGMGLLTFDWSMISYVANPLINPWWSEANMGIAIVLFYWILAPILYYTNTFFTSFLPMSAFTAFDNTGVPFNVSAVVDNGQFSVANYEAYSPVFVTATLAISYGLGLASFTALIVHSLLWYHRDIARGFRRSYKDERDVHSRLMRAYPEVPHLWYAVLGLISFIFIIAAIEVVPTQMPIWGAGLAVLVAFLLSLPIGLLAAISNQIMTLEVFYEFVAGYLWPGKPIANMIFKAIGYNSTLQAIGFVGDLKLGHYMKIPPRLMFVAQVGAGIVGCFVVILVQDWMFTNIPDFCSPLQKDGFICPNIEVVTLSSVVWGGVGPGRLFSVGKMYSPLLWFFLLGAVAPIPFYILARKYPYSIFRYANMPLLFNAGEAIPPASGINYSSFVLVGFISQWFMRRFHLRWWMRYNYILAAALDSGVAIGLVVVFFTVQFPKGGFSVKWWGNGFWQTTADAMGIPFRVAINGTFGPSAW